MRDHDCIGTGEVYTGNTGSMQYAPDSRTTFEIILKIASGAQLSLSPPPPHETPLRRLYFPQMCGSAGNAAKGFGIALRVDSTIQHETPKPATAAAVVSSTSDEGSSEDDAQAAAAAAAAAAAVAAAAAKRRRSGSLGSREPVRAELLALQLKECASEMEEHLLVQVFAAAGSCFAVEPLPLIVQRSVAYVVEPRSNVAVEVALLTLNMSTCLTDWTLELRS